MAETLVHALSRDGYFRIADVAENADDAIRRLPGLQVDLALVDVVLPRVSGIELVLWIRAKYPLLPCLMISGRTAGDYVSRSLAAGASGYVLKDDIHDIIRGIQHVLDGGMYLSRSLSQ